MESRLSARTFDLIRQQSSPDELRKALAGSLADNLG
jgi:hypothetical protein